MKRYLLLPLFSLISNFAEAQIKVSGKVSDRVAKTSLPGCIVFIENENRGTLTNEEGEFQIEVNDSEVILVFSFLGYSKEKIRVDSGKELEILLSPEALELNEAVVGNPAFTILKAAIEKSALNQDQSSFFRGYLRSVMNESSKPKSFNEIFFDGEWTTLGIINWKPTENRYAIEEDVLYKSESIFNFLSSFVRAGSVIRSNTLPNGINADLGLYNLRIKNKYKMDNGNDVVEIVCTPKSSKKPLFEGSVFVNLISENILRVKGVYYQEKSKHNIARDQTYEYEANFDEDKLGEIRFNSFKLRIKAKVKSVNIDEDVLIYAMHNYSSVLQNLLPVKGSQGQLKQKKYDPTFWFDKDIIKYTSDQSAFIERLTRRGRFTSNFLR